jgi:hypothetical protein
MYVKKVTWSVDPRTNGGRTVVIPKSLAAFFPVISRIGPCVDGTRASVASAMPHISSLTFRNLTPSSLHPHFTCTSLPCHCPEHTHNVVRYQIIGSNWI